MARGRKKSSPKSPDLKDMEGLQKFALQSRRLGFTGMSSIHPSQSDPINAVFSPTSEEVDYCRQVVRAFEEAESRGAGASALEGHLIDLPVVERARRTLALRRGRKPSPAALCSARDVRQYPAEPLPTPTVCGPGTTSMLVCGVPLFT